MFMNDYAPCIELSLPLSRVQLVVQSTEKDSAGIRGSNLSRAPHCVITRKAEQMIGMAVR